MRRRGGCTQQQQRQGLCSGCSGCSGCLEHAVRSLHGAAGADAVRGSQRGHCSCWAGKQRPGTQERQKGVLCMRAGGGVRRCSRRDAKPDWDVRERVVIGALPLQLRARAGSSVPSTKVNSWACTRHGIPQPMSCSSGVDVVESGQCYYQAENALHHLHGCCLAHPCCMSVPPDWQGL